MPATIAKARRKATRAAGPPDGFVHYDEAAMQRLLTSPPEPLVSKFRVTADLVAAVLAPDGPSALKHLLRTNHDAEPPPPTPGGPSPCTAA